MQLTPRRDAARALIDLFMCARRKLKELRLRQHGQALERARARLELERFLLHKLPVNKALIYNLASSSSAAAAAEAADAVAGIAEHSIVIWVNSIGNCMGRWPA